MATQYPIRNKVSESSLLTIDLSEWFPDETIVDFDLQAWLTQGIMLQEKPFRQAADAHDWSQYEGKRVAVFCSVDAILPYWAFMLVASKLEPYAKDIYQGTSEALLNDWYRRALADLNPEDYTDRRIVVKGCGDKPIPAGAYVELVRKLQPAVKTIMYGEPCSTVPVYKKSRRSQPIPQDKPANTPTS